MSTAIDIFRTTLLSATAAVNDLGEQARKERERAYQQTYFARRYAADAEFRQRHRAQARDYWRRTHRVAGPVAGKGEGPRRGLGMKGTTGTHSQWEKSS